MTRPSSRQELYDRIHKTSKDEVILEEMIRLGFWPKSAGQPGDPGEEIRRRGELERRLDGLRTESRRLHDIEALKKEARKRRMEESRRKRAETKERTLRERAERAAAWKERKQSEILYLGEGVSAGLQGTEASPETLEKSGLPVLGTAAEIAAAMGIGVGELRFLAFHREAATTTHYVRFKIPKRTGGERLISAPMPRLKAAQRWILDTILARLAPHPAAHGFCEGRSIVSNARPHVGADVVVNLDLKDFFPTVSYRRVKGLFVHMGYSEAAATIFALLCTEPECVEAELDGITYHVAVGERFLPQGAPTSPAITNLLCRRMDRRLSGASQKLGFTYTRYADDLSFSASGDAVRAIGRLLRQVGWIVGQEGFFVHPDKTRVLRRSQRQEVTGVVVNERPAVPRAALRRFRATLYQIEKDGPEGKRWGPSGDRSGDVIAAIVGFANYVYMVDPAKGRELRRRTRALADRYGDKPPVPPPGGPEGGDPEHARSERGAADQAKASPPAGEPAGKKKSWWKIF
jgi:retron-type reverse transcriptase